MENEKVTSHNLLVYLAIIILSLFIILPPIFRTVFKENGSSSSEVKPTNNSKLASLQCKYNKYGYSIKAVTSYEEGEVTKISLVYTNNETDEDITSEYTAAQEKINDEIDKFSELIDAEYTNEGFTTKITLTSKTLEANEDDTDLSKRFGKVEDLKKYYEDLEYQCNILSN